MNNKLKHIAFRITPDMDNMLNNFINEQGVSKSYIIRKAIENYLETYNELKSIYPSFKKSFQHYHKLNKRCIADKMLKEIEE